jgi:hypothetical protein
VEKDDRITELGQQANYDTDTKMVASARLPGIPDTTSQVSMGMWSGNIL